MLEERTERGLLEEFIAELMPLMRLPRSWCSSGYLSRSLRAPRMLARGACAEESCACMHACMHALWGPANEPEPLQGGPLSITDVNSTA